MKTCGKCKEAKELVCFSKKTATPSGLNGTCKECDRKRHEKKKRVNIRKAIEYKGGKCERCKTVYPDWMYDFHHVNPDEKEYSVGRIMHRNWETVKKEADKCQLLCPNCHRTTHYEMRTGEKVNWTTTKNS